MPDPVTLALGVSISKLLLRWADLNDTADALQDARAGFGALRALGDRKAQDPVNSAIADLLSRRLRGVRDDGRRKDMEIVVTNVATLFAGLSDADIRVAAQNPDGFPEYLTDGPGRRLLSQTEAALTPFMRQVMEVGAGVFAELAPSSGRFASAALVRLLDQVDAVTFGIADLRDVLVATGADLSTTANAAAVHVELLHPKVDRLLECAERAGNPETAVSTSRQATADGVILGPPIGRWPSGRVGGLGVNASITVRAETSLTQYLPRPHDQQLRDLLQTLTNSSAVSRFVVLVGTSCTGKTRTLYEGVHYVLPDWQLVAPATDTALANILVSGVPDRTVVWLDELQNKITKGADGVVAARAITSLLDSDQVGPILFAGTLWPAELRELTRRPTPGQAASGTSVIPALLARAETISVPDVFTDADLATVVVDPRLKVAISTANKRGHPEHGRNVIQVLAGGTELVRRLKGDPAGPGAFAPAARAVVQAASDLRRLGMPNPLPYWALEGAAPGYIFGVTPPNDAVWLQVALGQLTEAATIDDPFVGRYELDVRVDGVPAMIQVRCTEADGSRIEGYSLHDYLLAGTGMRSEGFEIPDSVWITLLTNSGKVDRNTLLNLGNAAERRGAATWSIGFMRELAVRGDWTGQERLLFRLGNLAKSGDNSALAELRLWAERLGRQEALIEVLLTLEERGGGSEERRRELAALQAAGEMGVIHERRLLGYLEYLAREGTDDAVPLLREIADSRNLGVGYLARALVVAVQRGDHAALGELLVLCERSAIARPFAVYVLLDLLDSGDVIAKSLKDVLGWGVPRGTRLAGLAGLAMHGDREALNDLRTQTYGKTQRFFRVLGHLALAGNGDALMELKAAARTDKQAAKRYKHVMLAARHSGYGRQPNSSERHSHS